MSFKRIPLKYIASINDESLTENTEPDYEIQYVDIGNVDSQGNIKNIATYTFCKAPSRARRKVKDGDVIVSTVRTYLQAIASIKKPDHNLIVSTGFAVVRPKLNLLNDDYFKYAVREDKFLWEVKARSKGVSYPAINSSELSEVSVSLPPIEEQKQIADYLDRTTTQIDNLIAEKERMLALLEEKREALISQVVTKGLDPNIPLKPSGIEWLGDIPEHWQVKRLKYTAYFQRGFDLSSDNFKNGKIPVYGSNGIIGFHNAYTTKAPSITIGRSGSVGEVNFIENDYWAHNTSLFLQNDFNNNIRFLYYLLISINLKSESSGSAVGTLNRNYIHQITIGIPSLEEQKQIANYLDQQTKKIDELRSEINKSIELLKERRSALITAAVTGQIDIEEMKK